MNRRAALLLTAALAVLGLAGLAWWIASSDAPAGDAATGTSDPKAVLDGEPVAIYFPSTSGRLEPEMRNAPAEIDRDTLNLWLAEQLTAGPETGGLEPSLPAGTEVAGVFAAPDGTLYVDFTLPAEVTIGMSSTEELLALYSVVNTLLLDNEHSDRAVILFNGRQRETLAGHVDTSIPLAARPEFIRRPG